MRVPSVCEAMGICGLTDMRGIPFDVLEHAKLRGEEVHLWTQLLDHGHVGPDDEPDTSIEGYVAAYLLFKQEAGFEIIHNETAIVNTRDRYAGTVDRVAYRKKLMQPKRPFVVDLKCVALVSMATRLQVTGYAHAFDTNQDSPGLHGRESLQLRRDGTYRLKQYNSHDDYNDWAAVVRVAHWKLNNGLATLEE